MPALQVAPAWPEIGPLFGRLQYAFRQHVHSRFLSRTTRTAFQDDVACEIPVREHTFAPSQPRTIELRNLLANPFWKYLGFKSEDEVRRILREADAAGLVGKYVVADQLEQVTTCLTLDELLAKKARL